ncbi:hypothetical protein EG339_14225 [Chryseobacterium bernardetii]|uniref:Uncharacterized protein n=1 Tax=Chryseobacterium bernardetii TaxID=1241978 RepID=A0A3G6T8R7_9FLAO|nr:hypothetical protein EG339_14225 [Chryseobacterium bernardetii]
MEKRKKYRITLYLLFLFLYEFCLVPHLVIEENKFGTKGSKLYKITYILLSAAHLIFLNNIIRSQIIS